MTQKLQLLYGILSAPIEVQPVGAVFHVSADDFMEAIHGIPRPVPIECMFLFSEAAHTILPVGIEGSDLLFAIAAVLRLGWEEARTNRVDCPPIHEVEGHEVVRRCLRTLHGLVGRQEDRPLSSEPVVYCGTQRTSIRVTPKKLLDALCRMRREGRVAWDVFRTSVPNTHLHASVA